MQEGLLRRKVRMMKNIITRNKAMQRNTAISMQVSSMLFVRLIVRDV